MLSLGHYATGKDLNRRTLSLERGKTSHLFFPLVQKGNQLLSMICIQRTLLFHSNQADTYFNWVCLTSMTSHSLMNSQCMQKVDDASSIPPAGKRSALLHYSYKQLVKVILFQMAQRK